MISCRAGKKAMCLPANYWRNIDEPITNHIDPDQWRAFDAYLARPAQAGPAPGIVVIQEIFGVNPNIKGVADWLAERAIARSPLIFSGALSAMSQLPIRTMPNLKKPLV